jgi:multidrug efflux pump subunit AcrA (membrane-fusion protein)
MLNHKGQIKLTEIVLLFMVIMLSVMLFLKTSDKTGTPGSGGSESSGERKILFYRNPMNPAITSAAPAKDEMGMDYIPVYSDEGRVPPKTPEQEVEDFFAEEAPSVPGLASVTLSAHGIQVAGILTDVAVKEVFQNNIRTIGLVLIDETRMHRVQTKIEGWVEKLFINFLGQPVKKGDPLLSIYSPELLSSQEEFLRVIEGSGRKTDSLDETLIQSARHRLQLYDVPETFIEQLKNSRKIQREVTLTAPASGFVTGKDVSEGQKVEPGMVIFTISDLSVIWVEADFFEYESSALKIGLEAVLTSPFDSSLELKGIISYIYPYINLESRTLKVRFEFSNENLILKPGMYVDVNLMLNLGESVVIPGSAIIDSGVRKVVFVDKGEGVFQPREVRIGAKSKGKAQVLSGVKEGEKVAVKANFLLDSESKLQAIIQGKMN